MRQVLVGQQAPDFTVQAVKDGKIVNNYTLSQFRGKKYVVLFFYPLDFTFVCPTELHEFEAQREQFHKMGAEVIGCSVDSAHSHLAWLRTPMNEGGIEGCSYPILADLNKEVARNYGVLIPAKEDGSGGMALRATFIIDRSGTVQVQHVNNDAIGRNVAEVVRALEALQFTEEHGEVCPANWQQGKRGMKANAEGLKSYFGA